MPKSPLVLVFDSGLGGMTVLAELARLRPDVDYVYVADDAVFPYGRLPEPILIARVEAVFRTLVPQWRPDLAVIACHTASTLVLPGLRAAWPDLPFVGTVPAIKPAAEASRSRMISVLATPGTVARDYTQALVRDFASHCEVKLVGSVHLAGLAEAFLRGETVSDADIVAEIAPAFVAADGRRTDAVVLACTHYPLLGALLDRLAPWPVRWIDPALAIARRSDQLLRDQGAPPAARSLASLSPALFTSGAKPEAALEKALGARGVRAIDWSLPGSKAA